jgi:hypothetical protein
MLERKQLSQRDAGLPAPAALRSGSYYPAPGNGAVMRLSLLRAHSIQSVVSGIW